MWPKAHAAGESENDDYRFLGLQQLLQSICEVCLAAGYASCCNGTTPADRATVLFPSVFM